VKRPGSARPLFAFANALLGRPHLRVQSGPRAGRRRVSRACPTPSFRLSDANAAGALRCRDPTIFAPSTVAAAA